ncbi:hypothetical protein N824_12045 [Pedobacter sp. V48]|nr:hypothetical protein N824_12045 [Pedobacter sp. V48]
MLIAANLDKIVFICNLFAPQPAFEKKVLHLKYIHDGLIP